MLKIPIPMARLQELLDAADFSEDYREALEPCVDALLSHKEEFAERFYAVFSLIPATRVLLEQEEPFGRLRKLWSHWYETVLSNISTHELFGYLWRIGLRHVEVNLDQSYSNAAFSLARNFMHDVLEREFPLDTAFKAARAVDRLLDLCLLVETVAYIENLSHCDMNIMGGIADKVRNPVTVIGGNIRRLQKKGLAGSEASQAYEDIIAENAKLERMVGNIKKYIELFRLEPSVRRVSLTEALEGALARLRKEEDGFRMPNVEVRMDAEAGFVSGSPPEIEDMFFYLFMSCIEDPGYTGSTITVTTGFNDLPARHVRITVTCPGSKLRPDDSDRVMMPFSSQGSVGTGFSLPTVMLAVRKNHGKFSIEDLNGRGANLVVTLPPA